MGSCQSRIHVLPMRHRWRVGSIGGVESHQALARATSRPKRMRWSTVTAVRPPQAMQISPWGWRWRRG
jgi:hypothetical protein